MGGLFEGRRGAAILLALMLLFVVRVVMHFVNGPRPQSGDGSVLQDKAWEGMNRIDTGPEWMKGKFGTLVYGVFGGIFILVGIAAAIDVLIYGPKTQTTPAATPEANSNGGF